MPFGIVLSPISIGAGLNKYVEQAENFNVLDLILTRDIYLPILMFVGLIIISLIIKMKFFDDSN